MIANGLTSAERMAEAAETQIALSLARAEYNALSIGEHPDVLQDVYDELRMCEIEAREAFLDYTNPFRKNKYA